MVLSTSMIIKTVFSFVAFAILGIWACGCGSVECKDHPGNGDRCDTSDKYVCRQTNTCASLGCDDFCACSGGHWICSKRCIDGASDLCGTAPLCWYCSIPPDGIDAAAP